MISTEGLFAKAFMIVGRHIYILITNLGYRLPSGYSRLLMVKTSLVLVDQVIKVGIFEHVVTKQQWVITMQLIGMVIENMNVIDLRLTILFYNGKFHCFSRFGSPKTYAFHVDGKRAANTPHQVLHI